ncbi:hypothetical protein NC653_019804 [Populus alba x Populus x berolinensis]|uniref:Uncharacterized protein n=1 Tax=Populus alba x Populus x berolinensis TaxID=444605 RepID=A0AAD6MJ20_9ROSI|nr:hypothetical protein NC653_019804 [Populus alba x Populus x berolinensis]
MRGVHATKLLCVHSMEHLFFPPRVFSGSVFKSDFQCSSDPKNIPAKLAVVVTAQHRDIPRILFFGLLGIAYFFLAPVILPSSGVLLSCITSSSVTRLRYVDIQILLLPTYGQEDIQSPLMLSSFYPLSATLSPSVLMISYCRPMFPTPNTDAGYVFSDIDKEGQGRSK